MSEQAGGFVSAEVFDQFLASDWPRLMGATARHSRETEIPLHQCIDAWQPSLALSPKEERAMLIEMGIIEIEEPKPKKPYWAQFVQFTALGREVIAECEGLYTDEEYAQRDAEARVKLEQLKAEHEEWLAAHGVPGPTAPRQKGWLRGLLSKASSRED